MVLPNHRIVSDSCPPHVSSVFVYFYVDKTRHKMLEYFMSLYIVTCVKRSITVQDVNHLGAISS